MSELYESTSKQEWEQARRTAFIQHVLEHSQSVQ